MRYALEPPIGNACVNSISVSNGNIYCVGYYYSSIKERIQGCYWLNGVKHDIDGAANAKAVYIIDNKVFISGIHIGMFNAYVSYWIDGKLINTNDIADNMCTYNMFVKIRSQDKGINGLWVDNEGFQYIFKDGNYNFIIPYLGTIKGTYTIEGNTITMKDDNDYEGNQVLTGIINKDKLTISSEEDGSIKTYVYKRITHIE
jgi:hypothetical protein